MTDKPKPIEGEVFAPGEFVGEQSGSRVFFVGVDPAAGPDRADASPT